MKFTLYDNIHTFYDNAYDVLMTNEAQNMLILGNLIIGHKGEDTFGWRNTANWVMVSVADNTGVRLVGLMTPPWNLTLYAVGNKVDDAALQCLVDGLIAADIPIPGVITEKSLAEAFTKAYCSTKKLTHSIFMSQRIYELCTVNPEIPLIGSFRPAREQDLSFLPYWIADFIASAGQDSDISADIETSRYHITGGKLHVLEDNGMAVSIAKILRQTPGTACVGFVYTPPYLRGKGYASSVTAQISQLCLDAGYKSCVLYTDLSNPTSNSIYQKIGYTPICDSLEIKFQ